MKKLAVDFGTTNTVVAVWREAMQAPETIHLPGLSAPAAESQPPLIPSLVYVEDGMKCRVVAGQAVRAGGLDGQDDGRLFTSFKRGISARAHPLARVIDGAEWDEPKAGQAFLSAVIAGAWQAEGGLVDELVLTVPVQSFERYLKWLRDEVLVAAQQSGLGVQRVRIVDESTAAALGYDVRVPGDLILVFDFGGGTLDISLVRMPLADEGGGIIVEPDKNAIVAGSATHDGDRAEARVVAKAGRVLGGDDVDHWLIEEVLARNGVSRSQVGATYSQLKLAVEAAKVRLSEHETAEIGVFDPDSYLTLRASFTRSQLEEVLDRHEFFGMIQKTLDKVLRGARAKGIFPEDIGAVLMVGGTSRIPSVRRMVRTLFGAERVLEHKPFEAVAHGALGLAVGLGVDDYLYHSYGVRHLNPITGRHEWEEIIPAGTRYPLDEPIKLVLAASRDGQEVIELVIGEVEEGTGGVAEVMFGDRAILMVKGGLELRRVVPLNDQDGSRTVAYLDPVGKAGEDRIEVHFDVDKNRMLRVTVIDLLAKKSLLRNTPVVELR